MRLSKSVSLIEASSSERRRPMLRYEPNLVKLPRRLIDCFELSHQDKETTEFLQKAKEISLVQMFFSGFFSYFLSRTTSNGITGRGFMFVLSTEQARRLLRPADMSLEEYNAICLSGRKDPRLPSTPFRNFLDIGAGDGGVTARLTPLVDGATYATEYSMTMRWRLAQRGYTVLGHQNPFQKLDGSKEIMHYDLIALLNVLDRIDTPLDILHHIHTSLTPEGYFLLAVVLPWCPFVENGSRQDRPSQRLPMEGGNCCEGASFEDSLSRLVERVLEPAGFELVRWTKLPYLCQGNFKLEYAVLHDAVMVLKKKTSLEEEEESK